MYSAGNSTNAVGIWSRGIVLYLNETDWNCFSWSAESFLVAGLIFVCGVLGTTMTTNDQNRRLRTLKSRRNSVIQNTYTPNSAAQQNILVPVLYRIPNAWPSRCSAGQLLAHLLPSDSSNSSTSFSPAPLRLFFLCSAWHCTFSFSSVSPSLFHTFVYCYCLPLCFAV
ncbi:hypothetical protein BDV09DRAFT_96587 [Aspergillus tetrazonus]